ncbi:phage tail length tape measure family protein [Agrobacterium vaccinii]|uniref:phage tail length tape measure family protein n=1 Tax=Agrobacterium vaccinii TaxID=2735528 RepID=UPI001E5449FD|nr:phage tail length tape measure family protein [Agrobacterium vaccinii]UHS60617.1 phage tail length tape measure family protein [Agrobacterium vaccinii]
MDIAQLGIEVQSGGVKSATNDLKQFTNASRVAERAASGLSDASGKFSTSEIAAMSAAMGGVEKTSNAAAKAMAAAALAAQRAGSVGASGVKSLGQASGAARQQVQNLSYQMQDIVTMMAMGQSPFMLLAQQLPQVTQNGGQLNGVLSAIKQTITGLVSPLGLATTAFVFLGSAAISYFTEWMSKGSSANDLLKEQAQLIQTVADRWGDAIPALREYADQLTRAREAAELREGLSLLNDNTLESVRGRLSDVTLGLADLVSNLSAAGEEATVIRELQEAFARFAESAADGSLQVSEVERVQNALSAAVNSTGIPAIDSFRSFFDTLSASALKAAESVGAATQAANIAQSRINDPRTWRGVGLESNADGRIQGEMFPLPEDGPTPGSRPLIELEGMPKTKGGGAKQKAYESATASINEQTRALQAQTAAQQSLNPAINDYGYAVAKAKVETDLLLAAEKDKKAITPELTAQIGAQAEKYAQAVVEQNKFTEATKRANEATQFVKNTTAGFINDLRDGLKNGESFWSSFGSAALSVLDRITDKLLNEVLDAVFKVSNAGSGGGGGFLSSIFGSIFGGGNGGLGASGVPMYASGTASARAGMALVGEKGPEVVRFGGGEQVVPNNQLGNGFVGSRQAANANTPQSMHVTVGVSVDQDGNLQAYVKDVARSESAKISTAVVKQNEKNKRNLQQNGQAA